MLENIRLALSGLLSNKMRALLTMLGIIIGIGSVIAIVTVGNSLTASVSDSMSGLGANNVTVSITQKSTDADAYDGQNGVRVRMFEPTAPAEEDLLTDEMIAEYRAAFGGQVAAIELTEALGRGSASNGALSASVQAMGVNGEYGAAEGIELLAGRFVQDADGERQLAVVSDAFLQDAFGGALTPQSAVGQRFALAVNGRLLTFYILGVYRYEEEDTGAISLTAFSDETVTPLYLPLAAAKKIAGAAAGYQSFTVVGSAGADTQQFLSDTEQFFASYYTRNPSYTAAAGSLSSLLETMTGMLGTVSLAVSAIAGISLLVGGIGVMNIMLVSITERTREIGVRKALGAKNSAIRVQFIVEAMLICLIGGILGILVGLGLGSLGAGLMGTPAKVSLSTILLAVGFSMGIGVFFGYYPANKAAKMDPIEALRYE